MAGWTCWEDEKLDKSSVRLESQNCAVELATEHPAATRAVSYGQFIFLRWPTAVGDQCYCLCRGCENGVYILPVSLGSSSEWLSEGCLCLVSWH